jgi:hypothetical protein
MRCVKGGVMGLFGNLFEKKSCSICGGEIGLLGNRKLEDGNLCKSCASKLSPFFSERRHSTVEQIGQQLEYREANKARVAAFNPTRTLGNGRKVLVDEAGGAFVVTDSSRWRDENPDVIDVSQVTGCTVEVKESRTELHYTDKDGEERSYEPPRYDVDYDIWVTIRVNAPYFDEIELKVNPSRIETERSAEFNRYMEQADEIREVLMGARDRATAAPVPKVARTCEHCGATCVPDANGCCEYCGGAMG